MVFNFSKDSQVNTEIKINGETVETVSDKLDWNKNTDCIVKEANKRMSFLHKLSKFTTNKEDLKKIYILQVRSKLEQSSVVWHSSLTQTFVTIWITPSRLIHYRIILTCTCATWHAQPHPSQLLWLTSSEFHLLFGLAVSRNPLMLQNWRMLLGTWSRWRRWVIRIFQCLHWWCGIRFFGYLYH